MRLVIILLSSPTRIAQASPKVTCAAGLLKLCPDYKDVLSCLLPVSIAIAGKIHDGARRRVMEAKFLRAYIRRRHFIRNPFRHGSKPWLRLSFHWGHGE